MSVRSRAATARVEAICLDAGGVLVWPNWTRVCETLRRHGTIVSAAALARADPHARHALDMADIVNTSTDQRRGWDYFELVLKHAGVSVTDATAQALDELQAYHRELNLWEHVPAFVGPALEGLRAEGYRLALVSNANGTVRRAFERLGLASFFETIVDSEEEGIEKPDPRLFARALERIGAAPEAAVHAGDLYHVDVAGARRAGLTAVLVDEAGLYAGVDCPRIASVAALSAAISSR